MITKNLNLKQKNGASPIFSIHSFLCLECLSLPVTPGPILFILHDPVVGPPFCKISLSSFLDFFILFPFLSALWFLIYKPNLRCRWNDSLGSSCNFCLCFIVGSVLRQKPFYYYYYYSLKFRSQEKVEFFIRSIRWRRCTCREHPWTPN